MGSSPDDIGEVPVMKVKQWEGFRMSCDIGEATKGLENEAEPPMSQLILQPLVASPMS